MAAGRWTQRTRTRPARRAALPHAPGDEVGGSAAPPSEARVSCGALSAELLPLIQGRGQSPSLKTCSAPGHRSTQGSSALHARPQSAALRRWAGRVAPCSSSSSARAVCGPRASSGLPRVLGVAVLGVCGSSGAPRQTVGGAPRRRWRSSRRRGPCCPRPWRRALRLAGGGAPHCPDPAHCWVQTAC